MTQALWDSYLASAKGRYEEIDPAERYKIELGKALARAREALLRDERDWPKLVKAAVTHKQNNIINWRDHSKLTEWIDGNPDKAREALSEMWSEGERTPGDRVRAFDACVPESVFSRRSTGARLTAPARRPRRGNRRRLVVREYGPLTGLDENERRELERFALALPAGPEADQRPVLVVRNGRLHAQNCVGIIETRRGTVVEILPKIDLADVGNEARRPAAHPGEPAGGVADSSTGRDEDTRRVFLTMLRDWRGLGHSQLDAAAIRSVRRFDMLEAFVHLFLTRVVLLTRRGLARAYRTREANLPCLRGRILFPPHVRENLVDRSRFYVGYDEFTADRPANRLIHLALRRLAGFVRHPANRQRVHQLRIVFSDVPVSTDPDGDWTRHRVDRSMPHYDTVMPWVRLFLFGRGLATFAGPHVNRALLFPMEEVFEDFVTAAVRRHQRRFTVRAQGPMRSLAEDGAGRGAFRLKPDVALIERGRVRFILDAKWKRLDPGAPNHGVSQDDAYQLFAYGRSYGCRRVVLVYPRTTAFRETLVFRFVDDRDLELACFPFDVDDPAGATGTMMRDLLPR